MYKVARFVKNVLILAFVVMLCGAYYELTDSFKPVTLYKDKFGHSMFSIDSHTFFYVAAGFFILINVLNSLIANILKQIPAQKLPTPHKDFWLKNAETKTKLKEVYMAWVYSFALILNTFMTLLVGKIWFINRGIGGNLYEYGLFALSLVVILLFWLGFIFYRLRIRREEYIT